MDRLQMILTIFSLIVAFGNICIMAYTLSKFISKPHDDLSTRVSNIEVKVSEMERSLQLGNDGFREQRETNKVIQSCMLALIDFELAFCSHTDYHDEGINDLLKAREIIRQHLTK